VLAVATRDLCRVYQSRDGRPAVTALEQVTLDIHTGEVHGLLGPNGAGKTTLVKVLSTVLLPSSGSAAILGHDVVSETAAVRRLIGVVFGGDRGLYPWISGRHNLAYWAAAEVRAKLGHSAVRRVAICSGELCQREWVTGSPKGRLRRRRGHRVAEPG